MDESNETALSPVCRILLETPNRAADDALLDAVPRVSETEISSVVAVLLERATGAGLAGVIARFHAFPASVQESVLTQVDALYHALSAALRSKSSVRLRVNAVELIRRGAACRTASLLSAALVDTSHRVRELAAMALAHLGEGLMRREKRAITEVTEEMESGGMRFAEAGRRIVRLADERRHLISALEHALDSFDRHCRTEILEPTLWFIQSMGPVVWPRVSRPRSRTGRAMVELLVRQSDARFAAFAVQALQYAELRTPVAQALAAIRSDDFFVEVIRCGWLAADPRCRAGLGRIREMNWIRDNTAKIVAMPRHMQRKAVMIVSALGLSGHAKVCVLQEFLRAGSAELRRAALWALVDIEADTATQVLTVVSRWDDDTLAPIARRELRRRGVTVPKPPAEAAAAPASSPGAASGRDRHLTYEPTFEHFWMHFDDLDDAQRLDLLRACTLAGINVKAELRKRITSGTPSDQVRAISIAVQFGLIDAYRTEIYALVHDPTALVRATAVALLAHMPGPTAERMLRAALADADPRVQANAVMAIDAMGPSDRIDLLREKLEAESNRVRTNAIGVLLKHRVREAAESLIEMMSHPNRAYRLSAVWLAEHMELGPLAPRIANMAREDPDPQVRARAAEVASRLEQKRAPASEPAAVTEATK